MNAAHLFLILGVLPLAAWAAPADSRVDSGPATVSGVYSLTFRLAGGAPVPAGATLTCRARIRPSLPAGENLDARPAAFTIGRLGTPASCVVEIPIAWTVSHRPNSASLSYEIDAVSSIGATVRTVSQQGIAVPYPPAGGSARLDLTVSF
jgi:hypothetical protein